MRIRKEKIKETLRVLNNLSCSVLNSNIDDQEGKSVGTGVA